MTQAAFAHLHNIDRKTFGRWLKKYGNVVQKEISNQQQQQQQQKEDKPASSESDMMVSIPYIEYTALILSYLETVEFLPIYVSLGIVTI